MTDLQAILLGFGWGAFIGVPFGYGVVAILWRIEKRSMEKEGKNG